MKIVDLLESFTISVSNEEQKLLDKLNGPRDVDSFSERDKFIIDGLIRKNLVVKVKHNRSYSVVKNSIEIS